MVVILSGLAGRAGHQAVGTNGKTLVEGRNPLYFCICSLLFQAENGYISAFGTSKQQQLCMIPVAIGYTPAFEEETSRYITLQHMQVKRNHPKMAPASGTQPPCHCTVMLHPCLVRMVPSLADKPSINCRHFMLGNALLCIGRLARLLCTYKVILYSCLHVYVN
jgi:hypothetical protein